ncbi:MAG TPA: c-type cytochrome domain-containing protein [Pirellulales bacterium]|nr:c-type cytochrome domain-containing protein [Pirellulales bacterium]
MRHFLRLVAGLSLILMCGGQAFAAATPAQKRQMADAERSLKDLPSLFRAKKLEEFSERLAEAQTLISDLASTDAKGDPGLVVLERKVAAAQRLLEAFSENETKTAKPTRRPKPKKPAVTKPTEMGVSFMKEVFPIFSAKCGNCHIRSAKGGFSVATFADLKKGSDAGTVFFPGKAQGSRLMEVLASGDMPRGGAPLSDAEMTTLAKWIDAGAKFDGPSETAPLAAAGTPTPGTPGMLQAVRASGNESVQFIRDLAPVVVSQCVQCHAGMQPAGRLNLTSFSGLLRGGDSGPAIMPGKPKDSLLIKKLRGTAGDRMPLRKDPLSEDVIKQFEQWIADGAKLDWGNPADSLDWAVRTMTASKMTHEELAVMRSGLADKTWRLANPDVEPVKIEGDQFILLGNLSSVQMTEIAELAKAEQAKVAKLVQAPDDQPFVKGKVTLFALRRHFDYTEFGMMVEKRELPHDWRAHSRYSIVDCYGCLLVPQDDQKEAALLLAQVFASAYLDNQGQLPRWFIDGASRVIAARAEPRDPLGKLWQEQAKTALSDGRGPDEFLKAGETLSSEAQAMSYDFMKNVMSKSAKFTALLADTRKGVAFDAAFAKHFGAAPAALAELWAKSAATRRK